MSGSVNYTPQLGQPWAVVGNPITLRAYGQSGNAFGQQFVNNEGKLLTYRGAIRGLVLAATPTLVVNLVGAASVITSLRRVSISGAAATASQVIPVDLIAYSSAASGGTATTPTPIPAKSTDAAAAAVLQAYTANPTAGTAVGTFDTGNFTAGLITTAANRLTFDYGTRNDKVPQIVGVAQHIGLHFGGVTLANATTVNVVFEWTEEPSS